MYSVSPAVTHVAKKIAQIPGVQASFIARDGAVDAVLETAFDRPLRQHLIQIGMRSLVPVRVFYQMPDGNIVGESSDFRNEAIEDFYTNIHVAGFAGSDPSAPADQVAGDIYGDKDVGKDDKTRDENGQLKLTRIRSSSRGRPVVGWKHGKDSLKVGDKVQFKQPCVLQWSMGRTVRVEPGMTGAISQVSSKSPMAYLSMGNHSGIELPIHAIGHVYDVMSPPKMEAKQHGHRKVHNGYEGHGIVSPVSGAPSQFKRLVMTIGFGTPRDTIDATPNNIPGFRGRKLPDLIAYSHPLNTSKDDDAEEDMLVPPSAKGGYAGNKGSKAGKKGSKARPLDREPSVRTPWGKKKVLLSRK